MGFVEDHLWGYFRKFYQRVGSQIGTRKLQVAPGVWRGGRATRGPRAREMRRNFPQAGAGSITIFNLFVISKLTEMGSWG